MSKKLPYEGCYLYQRKSGSFYVQFRQRGRRNKKTLTLKARTEALAFAEAVEWGRKFEAGLFDPFVDRVETISLTGGGEAVRRAQPRVVEGHDSRAQDYAHPFCR